MTRATRLGSARVTAAAAPASSRFRAVAAMAGQASFDETRPLRSQRSSAVGCARRVSTWNGAATGSSYSHPNTHTHIRPRTHTHCSVLAERPLCAGSGPHAPVLTLPACTEPAAVRCNCQAGYLRGGSVSTRQVAAECALGVGSVARAGPTSYAYYEQSCGHCCNAQTALAGCAGRRKQGTCKQMRGRRRRNRSMAASSRATPTPSEAGGHARPEGRLRPRARTFIRPN